MVNLILVITLCSCSSYLGHRSPTPTEEVQADINHDGVLNVQDMLLMQRVLLGLQISWFDLSLILSKPFFTALPGHYPAGLCGSGDGDIYYVHNDHLGTPVKMTNEMGLVVWQAVYDPFGKASVNEDADGDGKAVEMNVRFPGQYYDAETGLHYNYFRTYDPDWVGILLVILLGCLVGLIRLGMLGGSWF